MAEDVLNMIGEAAVRAIVGHIIAEHRKLKAENTLLKKQTEIVVDRRPILALPSSEKQEAYMLPHMDVLLTVEIEALRHSVSDGFLKQMSWEKDARTVELPRLPPHFSLRPLHSYLESA